MPVPLKNDNVLEENEIVSNNTTYKQLNNISRVSWIKSSIIMFIILISAYLIYFYIKKSKE